MQHGDDVAAAGMDALRLAVLHAAGLLQPAVVDAHAWLATGHDAPPGAHRAGPGPRPPTGSTEGPRPDGDDPDTTRLVALVDLARAGDSEAFGQLYDYYVGMVYRFLYYRVGSHAVAEDLCSETFFRALRRMSSFTWQGRDFGAWLMTISRNLVADHFKSGRQRLEVVTEDMSDHDTAQEGPEDGVIAGLTNEVLLRGLRELAQEQQDCLVLRFLQGMSIAETAAILQRSEGAIKQLQLRATRNLAKLLPEGIR